MRTLKTCFYITLITLILFLAGDFIYSKLVNPQKIATAGRTKNEIYHHDLLPNFNGPASYGPIIYKICTDGSGFRTNCDTVVQNKEIKKNFDIAFIGDSFTEGIGLPYEDTFVGFFAQNNKGLSVANLGVASYSPVIYYTKIKHLLEQGYTFQHIIVFPDLSDIQDEAIFYELRDEAVMDRYADSQQRSIAAYIPPQMNIPEEQRSLALRAWLNFKDNHKKRFRITVMAGDALLHFANTLSQDKNGTVAKYYEYRPMNDRAKWTYSENLDSYRDLGIQGGIESALFYMEKLSDLLRENNIKMSVGVYPWEEQLRNDPLQKNNPSVTLWKEFCARKKCANFINASDIFFDEVKRTGVNATVQSYYINGDLHFNKEGNRRIYEAIEKDFSNK